MNKRTKRLMDKYLLLQNSSWYKKLNSNLKKMIFPIVGFTALLWFIVRVIPKPSRASYPCMQAAAPIASSFILYLIGLAASITVFNKGRNLLRKSRYLSATLLIFASFGIGLLAINIISDDSIAEETIVYEFNDPLGPNNPIGVAKGIFPGRVVWVYNPDATNENCTNGGFDDAYFTNENTKQDVVDEMFSQGILSLTGKENHSDAWEAIFKYFNIQHGKGEVGYNPEETIFIKINAVSAWSGIGNDGEMKSFSDESDTTPQTILAMIKHLVNEAGVTESNIYLGDPIAGIWNHVYDYIYSEFPNVHFMDKDGRATGRQKLVQSPEVAVTYSDKQAILTQYDFEGKHLLYQSMKNADYLLNIPSMKGHRWAGVTLFSKNHFGSNTNGTSWQLHAGLMNNDNKELRTGYKKYRVLVDLMSSENLGGKTLLYFMDALWSTSYEHQLPQKFTSSPFNNDWSSSLIFSLDHVAIESFCIDLLQKEFTEADMNTNPPRYNYVQWDGVDDYLHQAADSNWWPEEIKYDPDDSETSIPSLGVHEHWNNVDDMEYSRNLGTGDGIELIKIFNQPTSIENRTSNFPNKFELFNNYPNPFNPSTNIKFNLITSGETKLEIYNSNGELVDELINKVLPIGQHQFSWHGKSLASSTYFYKLTHNGLSKTKKMLLIK